MDYEQMLNNIKNNYEENGLEFELITDYKIELKKATIGVELIYNTNLYIDGNMRIGVLAEDTNYMIRTFEKQSNKKEVLKQIIENIKILREFKI